MANKKKVVKNKNQSKTEHTVKNAKRRDTFLDVDGSSSDEDDEYNDDGGREPRPSSLVITEASEGHSNPFKISNRLRE